MGELIFFKGGKEIARLTHEQIEQQGIMWRRPVEKCLDDILSPIQFQIEIAGIKVRHPDSEGVRLEEGNTGRGKHGKRVTPMHLAWVYKPSLDWTALAPGTASKCEGDNEAYVLHSQDN